MQLEDCRKAVACFVDKKPYSSGQYFSVFNTSYPTWKKLPRHIPTVVMVPEFGFELYHALHAPGVYMFITKGYERVSRMALRVLWEKLRESGNKFVCSDPLMWAISRNNAPYVWKRIDIFFPIPQRQQKAMVEGCVSDVDPASDTHFCFLPTQYDIAGAQQKYNSRVIDGLPTASVAAWF